MIKVNALWSNATLKLRNVRSLTFPRVWNATMATPVRLVVVAVRENAFRQQRLPAIISTHAITPAHATQKPEYARRLCLNPMGPFATTLTCALWVTVAWKVRV